METPVESGLGARQRGDRRLPEADSAVPGRNEVIGPNFQTSGFQAGPEIAQQHLILKNAPGENDSADSERAAKSDHRIANTTSQAALKRASNITRVAAAQTVANDGREKRTKVQFSFREWERVGIRRR